MNTSFLQRVANALGRMGLAMRVLGGAPAPSPPLRLLAELGFAPRSLIHVGASTGQEVQAYRAGGITSAILVEALPAPFKALRGAVQGIPGYVAVQALCAEADGVEQVFHVADNRGESSSLLPPGWHLTEHPEVGFTESIRMKATTIDAIIAAQGGTVPDLLVLDVQGAERRVLDGAANSLPAFRFLWVEVNYGGLYAGDTPIEVLLDGLRARGFRLAGLTMTRHGWGDALLVRRDLLRGAMADTQGPSHAE